MNILNKALLYLVLLPKKLYEKMGVSNAHLKAILTYKLIMDDRRPNSIQQSKQRNATKKKEVSNASIGTIFLSAVMGTVFWFSCTLEKISLHS